MAWDGNKMTWQESPEQPGQATPQEGTNQNPQGDDSPDYTKPPISEEGWKATPWGQNQTLYGDPGFRTAKDPHAYPYPKAGEPPNTPEGSRIRELIERYAKKYGAPVQLMFNKAHVESGGTWNPVLTNPDTWAMGLFQFIPDTAKRLNIRNAYDLEQNVEAASRYMSDLLRRSNGDPIQAEVGYHGGWNPLMGKADIPGNTRHHLGKVFPGQTDNLPTRMPVPKKPVEYPLSPFKFWEKIQSGM